MRAGVYREPVILVRKIEERCMLMWHRVCRLMSNIDWYLILAEAGVLKDGISDGTSKSVY
jgi:hypothetical protein